MSLLSILHKSTRIEQTLEIQAVILNRIRNDELTPTELAHLSRAFDVQEDRLRELRQKPKAGFLRPEKKSGTRAKLHVVPMPDSVANSVAIGHKIA